MFLVTNRSSTGRQPDVVFLVLFTMDFLWSLLPKSCPGWLSSALWRARQTAFSGPIDPPPSWAHPLAAIPSLSTAPRRAPPRPGHAAPICRHLSPRTPAESRLRCYRGLVWTFNGGWNMLWKATRSKRLLVENNRWIANMSHGDQMSKVKLPKCRI